MGRRYLYFRVCISSIWQLIKLMINPPNIEEDSYIEEPCPGLEGAILLADKKQTYGEYTTAFYCVNVIKRSIQSADRKYCKCDGYYICGFDLHYNYMPVVYDAYNITEKRIKIDLYTAFINCEKVKRYYIKYADINAILHLHCDMQTLCNARDYGSALYALSARSERTFIDKSYIDDTIGGGKSLRFTYNIELTPNGKCLFLQD